MGFYVVAVIRNQFGNTEEHRFGAFQSTVRAERVAENLSTRADVLSAQIVFIAPKATLAEPSDWSPLTAEERRAREEALLATQIRN